MDAFQLNNYIIFLIWVVLQLSYFFIFFLIHSYIFTYLSCSVNVCRLTVLNLRYYSLFNICSPKIDNSHLPLAFLDYLIKIFLCTFCPGMFLHMYFVRVWKLNWTDDVHNVLWFSITNLFSETSFSINILIKSIFVMHGVLKKYFFLHTYSQLASKYVFVKFSFIQHELYEKYKNAINNIQWY